MFKWISVFIVCCLPTLSSSAQKTVSVSTTKPFVLGTTVEMESRLLAERRKLNIYLPPGYNEKDTTRYPVIYLLDGSEEEDFIHVAGLVQFMQFPWVNLLPQSIVIGIANIDRRRDFTFPTSIAKDQKDFPTAGRSADFINFIEFELQPLIGGMYKTTEAKTIVGQSLGGLLATEVLLKRPELFTKYLIVSPSLWWDDESLLSGPPQVAKSASTDPITVFIAAGAEGKRMQADIKRLVSILGNANSKKLRVRIQYFPHENHASILHLAAYNGFAALNQSRGKNK